MQRDAAPKTSEMDVALQIFEKDVVPKIFVQRDVALQIFEMDAALKIFVQRDVVPKTAVQRDAESALPPVHCLIVVGVVCCREFFRSVLWRKNVAWGLWIDQNVVCRMPMVWTIQKSMLNLEVVALAGVYFVKRLEFLRTGCLRSSLRLGRAESMDQMPISTIVLLGALMRP